MIGSIKIYKQDKILSPGMYPCHYSPKATVILVGENGEVQVDKVRKLVHEFDLQGYSIGIMTKEENKDKYGEKEN